MTRTADIHLFRHHLLAVLGLAPLVTLGAACDGEAPAERYQVPEGFTDGGELEGYEAPPGVPAPPAPIGLTLSVGPVASGQRVSFTITGATPGAMIHVVSGGSLGSSCPAVLAGDCLEVSHARFEGGVVADANGEAILEKFPSVTLSEGDSIFYQAFVTGPNLASPTVEAVADAALLDCRNAELLVSGDSLVHQDVVLVCEPLPVGGACAAVDDFVPWQAFDMAATQYSPSFISNNWTVEATCHESTITDECCYTMATLNPPPPPGGGGYAGRPFTVDGAPRRGLGLAASGWTATCGADTDALDGELRARLADAWALAGADEHASVASFARFGLELLHLGAPSHLVAAATRAMGDEIRHARSCFGVASTFAAEPVGPGRIDIGGSLEHSTDPPRILAHAVAEGCINETICMLQGVAARDACQDPAIRAALAEIVEDEARHVELSWQFVRWMIAEDPAYRALVAEVFASWQPGARPAADPRAAELQAWGVLDAETSWLVARRAMQQVVGPCAAALLQAPIASTASVVA